MREWIYLALAIVFEVCGTTCMKLSNGFEKPVFAVMMAICYIACFSIFTLALKTLDVGVAYAVWAGAGTALIAIIGIVFFKNSLDWIKIVSMLLIIAGVVGLNLRGSH